MLFVNPDYFINTETPGKFSSEVIAEIVFS